MKLTERTKDILTWVLVALWLALAGIYAASCRDKEPPAYPNREPFPLQSARQDAPPARMVLP